MSARQRSRLSQQTPTEAKALCNSSDSDDEEVTTVRKPAFVFDDSDADDSDADDDDEAASTAADATAAKIDNDEESDGEINKNSQDIAVERKRNFNNKKKKKNDDSNAAPVSNEKDSNFEAISIEEFSKLINAVEIGSSHIADEKMNASDAKHPRSELSTLLNVDVKGLDIDLIMRRRFGGMAVNEIPEELGAAAAGGAQRRRFAAAVAGTEKVRARIAKLSNKVRERENRTSCLGLTSSKAKQAVLGCPTSPPLNSLHSFKAPLKNCHMFLTCNAAILPIITSG